MAPDPEKKGLDYSLPPVISQSLGRLLKHISQLNYEILNKHLQSLHLTVKGIAVLSILQNCTTCSQMQLATDLCIDRTTMVAIIDELERQHFVERTRHPSDRRQYIILLTPAGREIYQQALQRIQRAEEEFLAPLTEDQRQQLKLSLQLLLQGRGNHSPP